MTETLQSPLSAWGVTRERTPLLVVFALLIVEGIIIPPTLLIREQNVTVVIGSGCYGLMAAQVALLSMYLVFGSDPYWKRLVVHWSCVAVCLAAAFVGTTLLPSPPPQEGRYVEAGSEFLPIVCSLPATLLLLQLPLWIARWLAGWRFHSPQESTGASDPPTKPDAKLAIHDLLSITAVVAITLGAARFMPAGAIFTPVATWLFILIFGIVGGGIAAMIVLPPMSIFSDRRSLASCWVWTLGYAFLAETLMGMPILLLVRESQVATFLAQIAFVFCLATGVAAGLSMLRLHGVVIVRGNG
jgi:hypothetical protein